MLAAFDMVRFAVKWQAFDPRNLVFPQVETTKEFSKISGYERVLGNLGGEALVYYSIPSIEGYDPLYINRYGEFIGSLNDGKLRESFRSAVIFPKDVKYTEKAINLLGIKYIIHKLSDDNMPWTFPYWKYPNDYFDLIYKDERYKIFKNKKVYPRIFLVGEYKVINNSQKIIDTMFSKDFDLGRSVILEEDPHIEKYSGNIGKVSVLKYSVNEIDLKINANHEGMLFLSDNYYPGWIAKVDNRQVDIMRANYTFRSIKVPKGVHNVKFIYEPYSFKLGILAASIGSLFSLITYFYLYKKNNLL